MKPSHLIAIEDNLVSMERADDGVTEYTEIPRSDPKYWWYRAIITKREMTFWYNGARGIILSRGWRRGLTYLWALLSVRLGRSSNSIDWRRFGWYTEEQAQAAGIAPLSIFDIDTNDEEWRDAIA